MPCNIGYKSVSRMTIPQPQPLKFKKEVAAPEIDEELMDRLGESDTAFVEWVGELDAAPLLGEALKRAIADVASGGKVRYSVKDGRLVAEAKYSGAGAKRVIEREAAEVAERWTIEVLGIVAQLLDYDVVITRGPDGGFVLEGEKRSDKSVHEYLRVTSRGRSAGEFQFEHFASRRELAVERDRFVALALRLGIGLRLSATKERGQPIPLDAVHRDFFRIKE